MNVARWLLIGLLGLPLAEILIFVLVASQIGFGLALLTLLATSFAGALMLRYAGARMAGIRVVLGPQRITALEADGAGTMFLISGILLLVPGFITSAIGLLLLIAPLRRAVATLIMRAARRDVARAEGVVDLDRQDYRHVPQEQLDDRREPRP
jgi:UPF0716 protein FxsA